MTTRRIHPLPPEVFTKIAAGEVVERPASVVKELLENSVDAGATRIDIDAEQGGIELLRVVDNGCGILAEDLPLAFTSHATSKLTDADDLFRVRTMGFRGEALASIGGVAQVTLQSRAAGADTGAEIQCDGGKIGAGRPWNGSPGTRIEVRHLFYNTPVRRKFLRTPATEIGHISEAVTRLALAFDELHLKLTHNGKAVFEAPASADRLARIGLFFGGEVQGKLLPIAAEAGPARLTGFIADPGCDRGSARMQYLFVNRRWVRDRTLGHALQEAYHGLLMTGRYCVAFLFYELPPDLVDVNVHPTKSEVRFRDPQALYHLTQSTIRECLRRADLTATVSFRPAFAPFQPTPILPQGAFSREEEAPLLARAGETQAGETQAGETQAGETQASNGHVTPASSVEDPYRIPRAIQVHDSYLILETQGGMLVIDQHALHERILYEQWKERIREGNLERQPLLIPEPVDLQPDQAAAVLEHRQVLGELGLGVEDFGGGTVLVSSYPAILRRCSPAELLRATVEFLTSKDRPPSAEQLLDDLLRLMSCRSAIKAGDRLSTEEMAALIAHRHLADHTHHCPHGRPTALFFSKQELDRQFKRI